MTAHLHAGAPLEPSSGAVGRTTMLLADERRRDRLLGIDCWYPALARDSSAGTDPRSVYELLPGIGFTSSALADPPAAAGPHPLVVWSHGRSGTRSSYSMLCEGLASRGYVVLAPDHPGDTLGDWLLGAAADDATNETQRVADLRLVIDAALGDRAGLALAPEIDAEQVAVAGHSYGAFTSFALAGGDPREQRVRGAAGLQSFTRTLPRRVLERIDVPTLLVVGALDSTCPPATDADPAFAALAPKRGRRIDIEGAGHQACSDVGLYLELAPRVDGLPDIVVDFLASLADQVTGTAGEPWRPTVGLHLRILGAWLDELFDRDRDRARRDLDEVGQVPGVVTAGR
jgi:predicted dienelactone hydrolase